MVKKHYFLMFLLIFSGLSSVFGMQNKPLNPTYPKDGTIEQKKHWLRTYYKEHNIQPDKKNDAPNQNVEAPKKAGLRILAPAQWVFTSRAPLARYVRYGLAAAAIGTVLCFPAQAAKILLKDNIYNSLYQGLRYGFADMVGSMVKAPVLKNVALSTLYTCLGYKTIKDASSIGSSVVKGIKGGYNSAKNWCTDWFKEPSNK